MEKIYIAGGAQTDFERNWSKEGKGPIAMLREVVEDCLQNAGLDYGDIVSLGKDARIACYVGNFAGEQYTGQAHSGALLTEVSSAFYGIPSARYEAACASGSVALEAAIHGIMSGTRDVAIVVGWEIMKTVDSRRCGDILGAAALYEQESRNIAYPFPKLFGRLADATIDRYGLDRERYLCCLAEISAMNYKNAKRNPLAQTRRWHMSREKALRRGIKTNAIVSGNLATADCSQISDGAAAVVLVSETIRRRLNRKLPYVCGMGMRVAPMRMEEKLDNGRTTPFLLPWTRQAVLDAYCSAKLSVHDIDVFEIHDCFTSSEYVEISALGLTEPGEEYTAVESGLIAFDGQYPINPSGGLIGCGHPVGASGVRMFLDIAKQLRGEAGDYQIENAHHGLVLNIGGSATTNYVFILSAY